MDAYALAHLGHRIADLTRRAVKAVQDHRAPKPVYVPRHAFVRKPVEQRAKLIEPGHVTGHISVDLGGYVAQLTANVEHLGHLANAVRGDIHWIDIERADLERADDPGSGADRAAADDHAIV